jgi:hypothetical protein
MQAAPKLFTPVKHFLHLFTPKFSDSLKEILQPHLFQLLLYGKTLSQS